MPAKKRQPSAEEMLRWMEKNRDVVEPEGLGWIVCVGNVPETFYGRTLRAAILAAMKAERGKHGR